MTKLHIAEGGKYYVTATADVPERYCSRCGQQFNGFSDECGKTACDPALKITEFAKKEKFKVKKPIPVSIIKV